MAQDRIHAVLPSADRIACQTHRGTDLSYTEQAVLLHTTPPCIQISTRSWSPVSVPHVCLCSLFSVSCCCCCCCCSLPCVYSLLRPGRICRNWAMMQTCRGSNQQQRQTATSSQLESQSCLSLSLSLCTAAARIQS